MGTTEVIVRMAHTAPSAYKSDREPCRRSSAPRLGTVGVVKFHIFARITAACGAFRDLTLPRTRGRHCRGELIKSHTYTTVSYLSERTRWASLD